MKIAILSDTHGNVRPVSEALSILECMDVKTILHCGDVGGESIVQMLAPFDAHIVGGNTDEWISLEKAVKTANLDWQGEFGSFQAESVKIGFTHGHLYDRLSKEVNSGRWNLICTGHTHIEDYSIESNGTQRLNPGAFYRVATPGFAIVTVNGDKISVEHIHL
jgi:putative phosphoesterase